MPIQSPKIHSDTLIELGENAIQRDIIKGGVLFYCDMDCFGLKPSKCLGRGISGKIEEINDRGRKSYEIVLCRIGGDGSEKRSTERTFIKFTLGKQKIHIWGMNLEPELRSLNGIRVSDFLMDYIMEYCRQRTGLHVFDTGKINKPLLAKLLVRHGFHPQSKKVGVEILGSKKSKGNMNPIEVILYSDKDYKPKNHSDSGKFWYHIRGKVEGLNSVDGEKNRNIIYIDTEYNYTKAQGVSEDVRSLVLEILSNVKKR